MTHIVFISCSILSILFILIATVVAQFLYPNTRALPFARVNDDFVGSLAHPEIADVARQIHSQLQ